jgi:hypothetical protein
LELRQNLALRPAGFRVEAPHVPLEAVGESSVRKEEAPYGGVGASSKKVPCGEVMGGKTITVFNLTPVADKSRDIFTKMVKVNGLEQPGQPKRP